MKALLTKSILLFSLLLSFQSISAENLDSAPTVYDQFRTLLVNFPQDLVDDETVIRVSFMINEESKIVVLTTDNKELDAYVKNSLNYKTLKNHSLKANQLYFLPVKLIMA